jgi:hypothetical protein
MAMRRVCLALVAAAAAPAMGARLTLLAARGTRQESQDVLVRPRVLGASHNLTGHKPELAVDGNAATCWLVPGGQRMEKMSHDKWLILDLGRTCTPSALSILGVASTFGGARICVDRADAPSGPWRRLATLRGLCSLRAPAQCRLPADAPPSRYYRLYMRREGHATFRHALHDVAFVCPPAEGRK